MQIAGKYAPLTSAKTSARTQRSVRADGEIAFNASIYVLVRSCGAILFKAHVEHGCDERHRKQHRVCHECGGYALYVYAYSGIEHIVVYPDGVAYRGAYSPAYTA